MRLFPILVFFLLVGGGGLYYLNQGLLSQDVPYVVPPKASGPVVVTSPKSGAVVASPLIIKGKARGNWYFEASFPVILQDASGEILGQTVAQAQGEWMTSDYVPFTATLSFTQPATPGGMLVFKKTILQV